MPSSRNHRRGRRRKRPGLLGVLLVGFMLCLLMVLAFTMTTLHTIGTPTAHNKNNEQPFWEQRQRDLHRANLQILHDKKVAADRDRAPPLPPLPSPKSPRPPLLLPPASTNEMIDMRNLTYELAFANPDGGAWKQGWDVSPRPPSTRGKLRIFVVPHSHCDPGWIKTFDQYFRQQTSGILTTIIQALQKDPRRKFIWAEISYFSWWWQEQVDATQQIALKLIQSGQLEFVTGGWVQPDEANSELYAMEVQLQEGHAWIRDHVGQEFVPRYSWSIDPFGYSPTAAYLWQKYNMTGMLIQRVHYAVKKELAKRKSLEFYWRQTWDDASKSHDIFTHVMPFFSYDVPHTCGPNPAVCCQFDFARVKGVTSFTCPWHQPPQLITESNVASRATLLLDQYRKKAALYRSNALLVPLGDDFRWQTPREAESQFTNYQQIFDYINANVDDVQIQWGTLSEYFEAAKNTFPETVPVLKGSFFTYSDVNEDYWSGYFTSRVFDKALDRRLERVLYAAESMGATATALQGPRRALSLFQHHDGVTGTAKDHVVEDYARRIYDAIHETENWIIQQKSLPYKACLTSASPRKLSVNACQGSSVVAYNPLEVVQWCGSNGVPARSFANVTLPCETPLPQGAEGYVFDPKTGLMLEPVKEEWKYWLVSKGGAYLFFPGTLNDYELSDHELKILQGGSVVETKFWKRTVVEKKVGKATVLDFIYETYLQMDNQEWLARFSAPIENKGYFHTDLNGFNFDTHRFRADMPLQSQVFPMPTLASIEDNHKRLTIISEHAQGTASIEDGSIDIWLDRRLRHDDSRGLGQGVKDNQRTRTKLRVILETQYSSPQSEYELTPLGHSMWDEVQHPLELFGERNATLEREHEEATAKMEMPAGVRARTDPKKRLGNYGAVARRPPAPVPLRDLTQHELSVDDIAVPFVIMIYKRVDYLRKAIESLKMSDFPAKRVPLVVSIDGHVTDVIEYVESLKGDFDLEILIHPFSCHDHPKSFPGDDPELNKGFKGDKYGHPRTAKITCCKHHFTWLLSTVFTMDKLAKYDTFVFLEEDYIVAPSIYGAIASGFNAMKELSSETDGGFFGIGFDPTNGGLKSVPRTVDQESWSVAPFTSGPMTMERSAFVKIKENSESYCGLDGFDEYNWDWTIVHMQHQKLLPHTILVPAQILTKHIGIEGGMHEHKKAAHQGSDFLETQFHGTKIRGALKLKPRLAKPNGGWGHPADMEHCMKVVAGTAEEISDVGLSEHSNARLSEVDETTKTITNDTSTVSR